MRRILTAGVIVGAAVLLIGVGATVLGKFNEAVGWAFIGAGIVGLGWAVREAVRPVAGSIAETPPSSSLIVPGPKAALPKRKPTKIELVGSESDANLSIFDDGVVRWSPAHGSADFIKRGLLVAFRHVGGGDVVVNAHLTFVDVASGAQVRVNYGTWLGDVTRTAIFCAGDTHELVVATVNRRIRTNHTFEDARVNAGSGNIAAKYLPDGRYTLKVDLDLIDEYSGDVVPKSFDFDVVLDALNPHVCSIRKL